MNKVTIVSNNLDYADWVTVFLNGEKFCEGHFLHQRDFENLLTALGIAVENIATTTKDMENFVCK